MTPELEQPPPTTLMSGPASSEIAGALRRGGLAEICASGGRLQATLETRCGNCVLVHGRETKRLLAGLTLDTDHAKQHLPDLLAHSPGSLPAAQCEDCGRTYFIEDQK